MDIDADIVVIGSGIAGALTAWSLAQNGAKVAVLEAGPRIDRATIAANIQATARRDNTAGYPNARWAPRPDVNDGKTPYIQASGDGVFDFDYLRVVGGTSWLWTGGCDRMLPSDFQMKSRYNVGSDWPFGYDALELSYLEAERQLGVAGDSIAEIGSPRSAPFPLPPIVSSYLDGALSERLQHMNIAIRKRPAARNSLGYDGRPQCQGFGTCTPLCPTGAQYCSTTHIEKAERHGTRVLENCRVDGFDADASGRILSARFQRSDGEQGTARAKSFVLAANAVESPRLLLASANERFPRGLANSSDQVGRNFMAHLGYNVHFETPFLLYGNRGPRFTSSIGQFRDGSFRSERGAFAVTVYNQLDLFTLSTELLAQDVMPPELDDLIRARAAHTGSFGILVEHLPSPDNRISIDMQRRDSAGQPRIAVALSRSAHQDRGLAGSREILKTILDELKVTRSKFSDVFNAHHLMGTLRMGDDPRTSVTDAFGRCHDHPNLFIAGSSLFPSFGAASPSLTIAALALRTANEIARNK